MENIILNIRIQNIDEITMLLDKSIKEAEQLKETVAQLNEIKLEIETNVVTD